MTEESPIQDLQLDLSSINDGSLGISEIGPGLKLRKGFAYWVLGFIGVFIFVSSAAWYWAAEAGPNQLEVAHDIFEFSKDLLPFGTLVLGYFFGSILPDNTNDG